MTEKALKVGLTKHSRVVPLIPERLVRQAQEILENELEAIWTDTPEEMVISRQEVKSLLKKDKSPGFQWFYTYVNKGEVLEKDEELLDDRVDRLLAGEKIQCVFSLTEKSELRTVEKVNLNKTRIFMASPIDHLMACLTLFERQNQMLMDRIGEHPITIGIQIPGNQFVRMVSQLGSRCVDGDVDGCDLCFHPRIARAIRDIRARKLPPRYGKCVNWLYSTVYAGCAAGLGGIFRIIANKSGWCNTAHDNSLMLWMYILMGVLHFYPGQDWKTVIKILINGDDLIASYIGDFKGFCEFLKSIGCTIEAPDWTPRPPHHCVYLSHHLEKRYVHGFGDFFVAAGNLPKLLSSINWVKTSPKLSFEESCVAHLIGLRMCLFPWALHFEEVDELLSNYLRSVVMTDFIRDCLKARFSEIEMAYINTRAEGSLFSPTATLKQVLKGSYRLFKEVCYYD